MEWKLDMPFPSRIDTEMRNYTSLCSHFSRQIRQWTSAVKGNVIKLFDVTMVEGIDVSKYGRVDVELWETWEAVRTVIQDRIKM